LISKTLDTSNQQYTMNSLAMPNNTLTRSINELRWDEARAFLHSNPGYSSCQAFSSNRDWKYFLVRTPQGFNRYTLQNGMLIEIKKDY
jgi:hypothetical protein